MVSNVENKIVEGLAPNMKSQSNFDRIQIILDRIQVRLIVNRSF